MATIADVADYTGLSRATVSRVINDYPHVSKDKRQLVHEAMKELGYFPNTSARNLRNRRTNLVAVLIPRLTNPFFTLILDGIEKVAEENGFQLIICQTKSSKKKELEFLNLLQTKQVDGVIFTSIENDWEQIQPYTDHGPIILCNEYHHDATVPMVRLNQVQGSYLGTKHLIERGHQRLAYCMGSTSGLSNDRRKGFFQAVDEAGLEVKSEWIFHDTYTMEDGVKTFNKILTLAERPTAIFTGGDEVAAAMVKEAKRNGLDVPGDMAILGFDDQPIASMIEPELTTIYQPGAEIGSRAMTIFIDCLKGKRERVRQSVMELPLSLIIRKST
ncbi:LacI family DNA-binding transcriptional regulator [Bacillus sp. N1-1]|jgi:DNA-binding LacI/PurR family transcriptional regulator|uniref:LacI family DNA-binding transcriptional regulator n=1 Tax=Bacillus sp. N1-1 TaxID=2682541 RepID=UPI00131655A4|nr:LacI family DNA-binding transcriptional regulator [Bacillus sp. N1-1]QHA93187.1 LacI family DNA-binding transcriptional regulator [Bacillus sp. N1-1]